MSKILEKICAAYDQHQGGTHAWRDAFHDASDDDLREFYSAIGDSHDEFRSLADAANFSIPQAPHAGDENPSPQDGETGAGHPTGPFSHDGQDRPGHGEEIRPVGVDEKPNGIFGHLFGG